MPLPDAILTDPGHLTGLGNAECLGFLVHVSFLREVWYAGDKSLPPYMYIRLVYSERRDRIWVHGETVLVLDRPQEWRFFVPLNIIDLDRLDDPDGLFAFTGEVATGFEVFPLLRHPLWASPGSPGHDFSPQPMFRYSGFEIYCPN